MTLRLKTKNENENEKLNIFQKNFDFDILPKYGKKRDLIKDRYLVENNKYPHKYTIPSSYRKSFDNIPVYSIDPEGCKDADDAFSIWVDSWGKLTLAIHIADPTSYIDLESDLWKDIKDRVLTHYPSNTEPIHMMPDEILQLSSLMENSKGTKKNAISIITEISKDTYQPIGMVSIEFTTINVSRENALTYQEASRQLEENNRITEVLVCGLKISEALKKTRSSKTIGVKLNELENTRLIYRNDKVYFHIDDESVIIMKQMIAEFAIFANSFVGNYLKHNLGNIGIFRTCDTNSWIKQVDSKVTGRELMNQIIDNGISANYLSSVLSHDLVGMPEYCHFTSPIRRLSDCVCHYLVRYVYLTQKGYSGILTSPFLESELVEIASRCHTITKKERKIQYRDTKFRIIQAIANMFEIRQNPIPIKIRFTMYTGLFINFIIEQVAEFDVFVSYSLRIRNYPTKYIDYWRSNSRKTLFITQIKSLGRFDEGTLPELDQYIHNPL